jgi:hypothetical protein
MNNTQALGPRTSRPRRANQRSQLKATWRNAEQAECRVGDYGRLSRFIVLLESRRTNRGSRGVRKGAIERQHQRWAPGPVLSDRSSVPVTTLDSTGAKLSFEEPYAGNPLVRVCGGAGGQPPALPGRCRQDASSMLDRYAGLPVRGSQGSRENKEGGLPAPHSASQVDSGRAPKRKPRRLNAMKFCHHLSSAAG